ncbi:hypothetical protein HYH03_004458 [Edaphochlamys debaryana]|uniref:Guanylate cyclase domain-containing protein n=1 Tax=Edaphochlamys debaryana TaxID=47281 RepID=A0A835YA28_9CHLO|nr:hypothetical protein HYH03_004458 [Edaphochlamys debaryana]|eukprot:KAG2497722.1 hypothetical protein HYH03_004458 [Edaphochlamys debaryana]
MLLADALGERALPQPPSVSNAGGDAGSGWLDWGLAESWEAWEDELMSLPAGGLQLNAGAGADGGKGGGQSRTAAFLAPHSLAAPLLRRGALVDASGLAALEPALQRWGVHPTLAQMSITGGKTLGVPLDGSQLLLFLRADVFSAAGLPPPASWQELLQVAERLNGTSTPAAAGAAGASDQGPLFGFCLPPPRLLGSLALAVLAPMVQTNGTREGMYLDPSSLRPAAATLAMSYALSYLRRLATLSPPSAGYPASAAPPYSEAFAQGRCAMTVGSAAQFRRNSQAVHPAGPSAVRAQVLASLLPGSELVLSEGQSPAGDSLVPCTPGLCPYAVATEASAKGGPGGATAGTSGLRRSLRRGLQQGAQALVNRAPLLSPDGLVGAIVAGGEVTAQLLSWSLLSSVGGPSTSWELLLPPGSEVGPWRQEHFQDAQRWAAAGYDAADTASFLRAAQGSLDHPNVVWPLRVEGAVTHKRAVGTAADAVVALASAPSSPLGGSSGAVEVTAGDPRVAAVMGALADAVTALFGAGKPDPALRAAYLEGLSGRLTGVLHPAVHVDVSSTAPGAHASSQPTAARIGLIVGLVIGCTAAMAAGVLALGFFLGRQQRRAAGSSYWALVEAPPPGPATCIAVTDIEGSTSLWEALPEAVLDRALRTHHRVVRTTSSLYRGYESATEGDSFILAFATPAAAASFAVALQQALLEAEWPAELLAAPSCRPVFVTRREEVERAESVSLTPPPAAKPHKQALLPGSGGIISPHGGFGESRNAAGHHHSVWHGYRAAVMALTGNRAAQKPAAKKKPAIASSLTHEASAAADHGENGAEQSSNAQQQASTRSALYNAVSAFGPGFLASRLRVSLSIAGSRPLPAQASAAHQTAGGQQRDHERGAPWEHSERSQGLLDGPSAPEAQRSRPLLGLLGRMPEQCEGDLEDSGEGAEDGAEDVLEEVDPPASNELLVKLMLAARHKRGLAISELAPVVESTGGRMANSSGLMTIGTARDELQERFRCLAVETSASMSASHTRTLTVSSRQQDGSTGGGGRISSGTNGAGARRLSGTFFARMLNSGGSSGPNGLSSGTSQPTSKQSQHPAAEAGSDEHSGFLQSREASNNPGSSKVHRPASDGEEQRYAPRVHSGVAATLLAAGQPTRGRRLTSATVRAASAPSLVPSGPLPRVAEHEATLAGPSLAETQEEQQEEISGYLEASGCMAPLVDGGQRITTSDTTVGLPKGLPHQPTPGSLLAYIHRLFNASSSTHPGTAGQAAEEVVALVFAGLRVRVGLHCGVQAQEIVYNPASARQTFGGEALRVAKAVTDCASGGQVVLSGEVLAQVQLAGDLSDLPAVVMDIGEHQLFEAVPTLALAEGPCLEASPVLLDAAPAPAAPSTQLLQLVSAPLLGRLALMPPFRPAIHQYTPGFMDAPIGESVAVVVFRVAHASALLAWDAAVAAESLALLELFLRASLGRLLPSASASHGPCYLAAAPPGCPLGTFVAVFANPAAAAKWALEASSQLEGLPWPQELLSSRFGAPLEGLMRAEAESRDDAAAPRHGLKRGLTKALHKAAAPHHFITQSFTASTRPRPPPQPSTRAAQARDPLRQTGASHATDELLGSFGGDLLELFGMPKGVDHGPANTLSSLLEVGDSVPGLPTAKSLPPPGTSASTQPDRGKVANDSSVRKRLMSLGQGAPTSDKTPTVASTTMTSTPIDVTTSRLLETALSTDHAATASAVNSGQQGLSAGSMLPVPAAALFDDVSYPGAPRRLARPGSRHRSAWSRTQHPGGSETVCVDIGASGGTSPPSKYHGPQLQPPQPPRISLTSTVSSSTVHPSHDIAEGRSRGGATCPPREPSSPGNTAVGAPGPALLRPRSNTAKRTLSTRVLATMGFAGSLHGSFIASRTSPASSSTTATMTAAPNPHPLLSGMATEPFARPGGGASGTSGGGGASTSPRNLATVLRRKRSGDVNQSPSRLLESAAAVAAATALAVEDAEVVTLRGLRVRAGLAVGAVRVELCPMTGRVVYSGKPVTAAMTAAAAARLGTLYATQGAATAVAARQAAEAVSEAARSGVAGADGAAEPAAGALQALAAAVGEAEPSLAALTPRLVSAPATSRVTAEAGSTGGGAPVSLKRKEAFVRFRLVEKAVRTDQDEAA